MGSRAWRGFAGDGVASPFAALKPRHTRAGTRRRFEEAIGVSELIRYRFLSDETYRFTHEIKQIITWPEHPPLYDQLSVDGSLTVLERLPDKSVRVRLQGRATEQPLYTPALPDAWAEYQIGRRGELIKADPVAPLLPYIVFPVEPTALKVAWKSVENILDRPVAMSHTFAKVETVDGERSAYIVTEGHAAGNPAIGYSCVCLFGLARGRPLRRRAVITQRFEGFATLTMMVEEKSE